MSQDSGWFELLQQSTDKGGGMMLTAESLTGSDCSRHFKNTIGVWEVSLAEAKLAAFKSENVQG